MNYNFGIGIRLELVAEILELFPDFFIVVDLAVKNDPGGAVLIGDRLLAGFQIDNRKTTHRHSDMPLDIEAILVRPAVADCLIHAIEQLPVNRLPVPANHSCRSEERRVGKECRSRWSAYQ